MSLQYWETFTMSNLELAKKKLELKRVEYALDEMDVKILEREADIERIKSNKVAQDEAMERIKNEIKELEG